MLVLTRKLNEEIVLETPAGKVTVMVSRIDHGQKPKVRLAIDAPKRPVWRTELLERATPELPRE